MTMESAVAWPIQWENQAQTHSSTDKSQEHSLHLCWFQGVSSSEDAPAWCDGTGTLRWIGMQQLHVGAETLFLHFLEMLWFFKLQWGGVCQVLSNGVLWLRVDNLFRCESPGTGFNATKLQQTAGLFTVSGKWVIWWWMESMQHSELAPILCTPKATFVVQRTQLAD